MEYDEENFLARFRKNTKDFTALLLLADWHQEQGRPLVAEGFRVVSWLRIRPGYKHLRKSVRERLNDYKRTITGYDTGYMKPNILRSAWLDAAAQLHGLTFPHHSPRSLDYETVTDCVHSLAHAYPLLSEPERKRILHEAQRAAGIPVSR